ncbi:MAG: UDP-3-O-[3-hydroxymyristoyl] N-acetylglucosamine deacetylase [Gemmatimonadetes bacterium]|nr:UDP-3-O-[3-hydroxymyristoyl] N-acetylglucosamine deacetylase [Gemmatimonadota bacterium]MYD12176.1 UDP-3-O-[3-hydroxymyristoyl] N-acetylglucosamine deacetylase [Gemmatimonadota bacterium]MYI65582.1 UDP-3-O-[3-hydroxymyristoyl] N-acetylglucosamine deacetylase [Gemmatimonadota bacterium]
MANDYQHTIAGEFELAGIGIHSGEAVSLRARPAPQGSGITFKRTDLPDSPMVPAQLDFVTGTELNTSLGLDGARIATVEHVLAALSAFRVDNAVLELTGAEVPILDGSFVPWLEALRSVGRSRQSSPATLIEVRETITSRDGCQASYTALPHDGLRISATIDFDHGAIGRQYGDFRLDESAFLAEIARARTFGFKEDAPTLRERGFGIGASLDNTVVLDEEKVMNGRLRYPDEFLRHKVGDMVGDLALLGGRLRGHVVAERPSHRGNVALARDIREQHEREQRRSLIDVRRIMACLPHRYPMLLVDRILEFEPLKRIVGLKNVTINEPFFRGHFPDHPVMPGVLVIEAMAQVGGLLLMDSVDDPEGKVVYFMSLNNVKWRRPVTPGDQILFEMEVVNIRRMAWKMRGKGRVDGKVVAEAEMTARIVDK